MAPYLYEYLHLRKISSVYSFMHVDIFPIPERDFFGEMSLRKNKDSKKIWLQI